MDLIYKLHILLDILQEWGNKWKIKKLFPKIIFLGQIVEKKSKFIANIFYVETSKEAEEIIKNIKKKYYDARHNCYAYITIDNKEEIIEKCNDDGEPSRNSWSTYTYNSKSK